ncbi:GlsB/YeaQ/YmgE family stress response membrane protein [Actinomadura rupiterrae]|uniref:GlsB/YeaQ/YmgE family stress response membrane protein n=1 Tax=Actinomadura rupiterrae TaxID=559627 RepID=UPI0020A451B4|nr:GlsB/YeaQ/YmgE family stress response membrane protein [Actinomadura rupiterrae]MCP2341441.1 putative membrane protein YeaQ/YmgE (transglycosylase-associated protein family) [Actinomadura rupiterrae]
MTIGGIFTAIIFGAIIGALGRLIVPGKQNMSIWLTVGVGIVAAFAGTGLSHLFGLNTKGWNFWETLFQIAFAVIGVYLVAAFWPKKSY